MPRILTRALDVVRDVLTIDPKVRISLDRTHVDVRRSSRLWGI
jgi:hypothetical protein